MHGLVICWDQVSKCWYVWLGVHRISPTLMSEKEAKCWADGYSQGHDEVVRHIREWAREMDR